MQLLLVRGSGSELECMRISAAGVRTIIHSYQCSICRSTWCAQGVGDWVVRCRAWGVYGYICCTTCVCLPRGRLERTLK